jgi:cell division protein ZapA (FtsZ GTPase activity inhibitor)
MQYYDVQVCGHHFRVRSEQSEQYVKALAACVEQKMDERARKTKQILQLRTTIVSGE